MARLAPDAVSSGPARRPFAGRAAELTVLLAELARAQRGEVRIAVITGDAGVGKTALAREAAARAGGRTVTLLARGHPLGAATPFGVWVEALERHLRTLDAGRVARLAGLAAPELGPLLRSVEASRPDQPSRAASSYRLVEGLVGLIAGLAEEAPVVAVLDDLHLADPESWETLRFLAHDRPASPVLVIGTARPDELAEHPVAADVVLALEQDGALRRVRLQPMGREDLTQLTRQRVGERLVPDALLRWLEERSRGNPLFALGLIGALLDEGADLADPHLTALPEDLSERVRARLRGLDDNARATLELLSVVGTRAELSELARLGGRATDLLAVALDGLVRRRLVAAHEGAPGVVFEVAHPLVQEVVYESTGLARRRMLHRRIGRTLLSAGQLPAGAAHLARSADPGDDETVDALVAALREAEDRSQHRSATAVLAELVRLLPEGDERWLRVLDVMDPRADWVLAHLAEDHVVEAWEAMQRIEPLAEAGADHRRRAVVHLRLGCFGGVGGAGALTDASAACERAAELFAAAGDTAMALSARAAAAYVVTVRGEHLAAIARTEALLPAAEELGDPLALMHVLMHLSYQLPFLGRFEEAAEAELRGMELARQSGNAYRLAIFRHRHFALLAHVGRLAEARRAAADRSWDSPAAKDALASEFRIVVAWLAGDLPSAMAAAGRAQTRNRTRVSYRQTAFLSLGARAALDADRLDGVTQVLERLESASQGFTGVFAAYPPWVSAVLAWRLGRPGALAQLRSAAERMRRLGPPPETLWCLVDVAEAAVEQGAADVATWAAAEAARVAGPVGRLPLLAALAGLAAAVAGPDAARARGAIAVFDQLGYRLFLGRAQLALGRALAPEDPRAAIVALEDALQTLSACSADWHVERVLAAMRALGPRGRRAASSAAGPGGLSAREVEVARLAASGRTAREIGAALVIGERTVETHLRNAYTKLGIRSKRELIERAADLGIRT
jgi:DNA-binding CsgD family transcriptional regulator